MQKTKECCDIMVRVAVVKELNTECSKVSLYCLVQIPMECGDTLVVVAVVKKEMSVD